VITCRESQAGAVLDNLSLNNNVLDLSNGPSESYEFNRIENGESEGSPTVTLLFLENKE
jgi:hypothetical protein